MAKPKFKRGVDPQTMSNLYAQETTSKWKAPETFPQLRGRHKRVWVDFETTGLDWRGKDEPLGIVVATEEDSRYYPWGHRGGGNLDKNRVIRYIQNEVRDMEVGTLEGKFEIHMGKKIGIDFEAQNCQMREVQYAAALLSDQRRNFDMESLASDWLGQHKVDLDRSRIWDMPAAEVGPYAEQDGVLTRELDKYAEPKIAAENLERVFQLENDLMYCVCEMERNGAPLDMEKLPRWHREVRSKFTQLVMQIAEGSGLKVNPNSAMDLAQLAAVRGITYPRTAPTERNPLGSPSFTDEFLKTVEDPFFQMARVARALDGLDNRYLGKYLRAQKNGRLFYKLHQLKGDEYGTISGRFSSSAVNIQQVYAKNRQLKKAPEMRDYIIRELFIPDDPDCEWISADADQIEFRLFAHYSNSARLLQAYKDDPNIDFHNYVMSMLRRLVEIDRDDTKGINFGKLYAMGRDKMKDELGVDWDTAQELFDAYDKEFPEARELQNEAMSIARKRGYVMTMLKRRSRPDPERIHSALNRVIQGSAGDIMKLKLLEAYRNRKFLQMKMFFPVHDELDGQVPKGGKSRQHLSELLNTQIAELKLKVPITWGVKTGPNWAACK